MTFSILCSNNRKISTLISPSQHQQITPTFITLEKHRKHFRPKISQWAFHLSLNFLHSKFGPVSQSKRCPYLFYSLSFAHIYVQDSIFFFLWELIFLSSHTPPLLSLRFSITPSLLSLHSRYKNKLKTLLII